MKFYNSILVKLNNAIKFANSDIIQEKALSIILFDHLIEILLFNEVEDLTSSESLLLYSKKKQITIEYKNTITGKNGKYDNLLKYCKDNDIILFEEFEILKYLHQIRNKIYHRDEYKEESINVALMFYYSFLKSYLLRFTKRLYIIISGNNSYKPIEFGQTVCTKSIFESSPEDYYEKTIKFLFEKWSINNQIYELSTKIITKQIAEIETRLNMIETFHKKINYYSTLDNLIEKTNIFFNKSEKNIKPKNIDRILLINLFLKENKFLFETNLDYDYNYLYKLTNKLYKDFNSIHNEKYPYWIDFNNLKKRILKFKKTNEHNLLKNIIDIEAKVLNLYDDTLLAIINYEEYLHELVNASKYCTKKK